MEILLEKELYGWNINDVAKIVKEEFISNLPEHFNFIIRDVESYTPDESYIFTLDEIYDENEEIPEYVIDYVENQKENDFMAHCIGIYDDYGFFNIIVATTFKPREDNSNGRDNDNRILYISLTDDDGEVMYRINFVK